MSILNVGDKIKITTVCSEGGNYAKSKQGYIASVVSTDGVYVYVDFGDGNDGWFTNDGVSGFPFLEGEYVLVNQ